MFFLFSYFTIITIFLFSYFLLYIVCHNLTIYKFHIPLNLFELFTFSYLSAHPSFIRLPRFSFQIIMAAKKVISQLVAFMVISTLDFAVISSPKANTKGSTTFMSNFLFSLYSTLLKKQPFKYQNNIFVNMQKINNEYTIHIGANTPASIIRKGARK